MAWTGYFTYGGREFVNYPRTMTLAGTMGLHWVRRLPVGEDLESALGQNHASVTDAPWYDPDEPASAEFAGCIPLDVTGIEDSTLEAAVFEFTTEGGRVMKGRNTMKEVVFSLALVGASECAVDYGFRWLKRTLTNRGCFGVAGCNGQDLTYAACEPSAGAQSVLLLDGLHADSTDWELTLDGSPTGEAFDGGDAYGWQSAEWASIERSLRDGAITRAPRVTGKRSISGCGGEVWLVSFTLTTKPFEYGRTFRVIAGLGESEDPYATGMSGNSGSTTYAMESCPRPIYTPVYDPECPALVAPPTAPNLTIGCFPQFTGSWDRDYAEIPANVIPVWDEVRPIIHVTATGGDERWVRVVFYDGYATPTDDCDGRIGEFRISYIPAGRTITIDTARQKVYFMDENGNSRDAGSLVLGGANTPTKWFGLSCGGSYYVTLDHDSDADRDISLSLDLVARTA